MIFVMALTIAADTPITAPPRTPSTGIASVDCSPSPPRWREGSGMSTSNRSESPRQATSVSGGTARTSLAAEGALRKVLLSFGDPDVAAVNVGPSSGRLVRLFRVDFFGENPAREYGGAVNRQQERFQVPEGLGAHVARDRLDDRLIFRFKGTPEGFH